MANEIAILDRDKASGTIRALFLYPVTTPVQVGGANVVPTPSAGLPALGSLVLTTQERAALDNGTLVFELVSFAFNPDITPAQAATALKARWVTAQAAAAANYGVTYQFIGTRLTAP
jgi:hypothetical protein